MTDISLVFEKGLGLKPDHGLTQSELAEKYTELLKNRLGGDPMVYPIKTKQDEQIKTSMNRLRSRIQEGMSRNFSSYRVYYALDQVWDAPFKQISPTLLAGFLETEPDEEKVRHQLEDWGLTNLLDQEKDAKTGLPTGKKIFNWPVFTKIVVPLVKAYLTIRWAKIMNDRRLIPFFKYEPVKVTTPMRLKCETLTDRVQIISNQYGYYDVTKQSVLKMLHYGNCFQMPKESWHSEQQWKKADLEDVASGKKKDDGSAASLGDEIKVTVREGIRYHHPHPTRVFYDLAHGPYTFNYDSGCEFVGYWRIARYREIWNGSFWNKDRISYGTGDLITGNRLFFASVYSACTLSIPCPAPPPKAGDGSTMSATVGVGATELDRERSIANQFYGMEQMDAGVLVTEYFEKLIPKDNGLGDYDCPVWFRFMVAGDGCTILFAEPLPYCPVVYYGYDEDSNRTQNASLALEILPFQDQFTNVLSQILITAKQNLANLVMFDEAQISEDLKRKVLNFGSWLYQGINGGWYDSRKATRAQQRIAEAVQVFSLPKGNTAEQINVLKTILDVLERALVMSSHEVAQAASHEQTREEVRNIAQSTSSRLTFTATPVDIARDAWKRQIYSGLMAFGDDDIYVHIPNDIVLSQEALTAMGFTYVDSDTHSNGDRFRRARTTKKATAAPMWEFSSTRDGEDRTSDKDTAVAMSSIIRDMLNNPITAQAIGPDQAIQIANQIAQLAGLPRDFKLINATSDQQKQAQAQQMLQGVIQQILPMLHQEMGKELMPLLEKVKENDQQIQQLAAKNNGKAKESISINYSQAPPSIQRQIEAAAGFQPAYGEPNPVHVDKMASAISKVLPPEPHPPHPTEQALNVANAMAAVTPEEAPNPAAE